jgi:zinc/manganese transport system substrate-binding protein
MSALIRIIMAALVVAGLFAGAAEAAKLRVVATIPDLKSLAAEVGGDLVEADSLARGTQNAHDMEIRPSLMLKLRRADVLIVNGLELDTWADLVVQGANNPNVVRGARGYVDASRGVQVLEVPTGRVDRSMGDVHPFGNPHYSLDPGQAEMVTANIVEGFARVAPEHRAAFERNRLAFLGRLAEAMRGWTTALEPFKGARVVTYHPTFTYFLARFGLVQGGTIEDRPGIPPSPMHLTQLIRKMKDEKTKVVVVEPWADRALAARVAEEAGAKVITLAPVVGAVKGADTYLAAIDYNVRTFALALR